MRNSGLIEPFAVQEIFVDGFTKHAIHRGNMSCVGYRMQPAADDAEPVKVVVIRLVWPAVATDEAIADARGAQTTPLETNPGRRLKH